MTGPNAADLERDPRFQTHLFSYQHEGDEWIIGIKATSERDARQRAEAIARSGVYDGVLMEKVPAWLAPWIPIEVWIRNLFTRRRP